MPVDRALNILTGWVEHIEGSSQFMSSGGGESEMSEEEVTEANVKSRTRKKK